MVVILESKLRDEIFMLSRQHSESCFNSQIKSFVCKLCYASWATFAWSIILSPTSAGKQRYLYNIQSGFLKNVLSENYSNKLSFFDCFVIEFSCSPQFWNLRINNYCTRTNFIFFHAVSYFYTVGPTKNRDAPCMLGNLQ